jgi:hypothetical protein
MNMKKHSIFLFILAICASITCHACSCFPKSGTFPDDDKDKKDFTLKLVRVSPETIKIEEPGGTGDVIFKIGWFGDKTYQCKESGIAIKLTVIGNEPTKNKRLAIRYSRDFGGSLMVINDEEKFIPRSAYDGAEVKLDLMDFRDGVHFSQKVEIKLELLYDGKLLDNPDSKLSFFWKR